MKNLLAGFILIILSVSCKTNKDTSANLINFIPSNSLYIIDTPDINNFLQQIDSVGIFQNSNSFFTSDIESHLRSFSNYSKTGAVIIAITQDEKDEINYVLIAKEHPGEFKIDSVKNKSAETLTYKDFVIQKYGLEEINFFTAEREGVFLASNSRLQLEQILKNGFTALTSDDLFVKIHSAIDKEKTSVILNSLSLNDLIANIFKDIFPPAHNLAPWNVLEIDTAINAISLNGISTWNESNPSLLKIFTSTGNQINELAGITPADAKGFYSFTYENVDVLLKNLNDYRNSDISIPADHLINYTAEAGIVTLKNGNKLPVLRSTDSELARELLIPLQETGIFRNIDIFNTPSDLKIFEFLNPLIPEGKSSHYIWIENFIVFAENTNDLEEVITSHLNNMTLGNQEYYNSTMENLAASSSLLLVTNNAGAISSSQSKTEQGASRVNNFPVVSLQFVVEKDFAHIHGTYGMSGNFSSGPIGQIASVILESPLATLAFPMKNPGKEQAEILVQDEKNLLYSYSSSGTRIWKKELSHRVMGDIEQVDLSGNGNFQYAFTTPYALHVIDRKGNPVKPFPLEFKDEITQPLSIFDYDNNSTYRFVLTQGNNILMYDARGRAVKGFDTEKFSSDIIQPPKHIRLNNKDYILVPESSGKLNILSRQGKSRIDVKDDVDFSASTWFPHKGNFVSVSSKGRLITVFENGNISTEPIGENGNIRVAANEEVLVVLADNTFKINDRALTLDYGLYTSPIIFTVGNKTYISLTDTQAQRVFLFDEKANLLPGFPVYGNSEVRFLNNRDNVKIFGVQGGSNEVIIYQF